jgi:hypothetical protein
MEIETKDLYIIGIACFGILATTFYIFYKLLL